MIEIPIIGDYKVTAGNVEYNDCVRQMSFTINDLAYTSDIEALNKKIDALADVSHTNDGAMTLAIDSALNSFETIDEVNEVLTNNYALLTKLDEYVLKSELPPAADLSEYRRKDDLLSYTDGTICKDIEFTKTGNWHKLNISYLNDVHFTLKYENITYDFDFTMDEQTGTNPIEYDHNINNNLKLKWVTSTDKNTSAEPLSGSNIYLLDSNNIILECDLLSITYKAPDEFALKSQIEELKAENESLKATIMMMEKLFWIDLSFTNYDGYYVKFGDWWNGTDDVSYITYRLIGYYIDSENNRKYFDFIYEYFIYEKLDEPDPEYRSYIYDGNQTVVMIAEGRAFWVKELVNTEWVDRKTYFTGAKRKA